MNKPTQVARLKEVTLVDEPVLNVSETLKRQIDFYHSKVGGKEWSGILFYTVDKGDINSPEDFECTAQRMFLMDVGSETYTEYEFGEVIMDVYDKYPELMDMKIGHIHTHHNMSTFFSGVDMGELHTNAPNHNYYLSLIVNISEKYSARFAFVGEEESVGSISFKGTTGEQDEIKLAKSKSDVLVMMDCDIKLPEDISIDQFDAERYESIMKVKREAATKKTVYTEGWDKLTSNRGASAPGFRYGNQRSLFDDSSRGYTADHWDRDYRNVPTIGNKSVEVPLYESKARFTNVEVAKFLTSLLTLDMEYKGNLEEAVKDVAASEKPSSFGIYSDIVQDRFNDFYELSFGTHPTADQQFALSDDCIDMIKPFKGQFAIVEHIIEALDTVRTDAQTEIFDDLEMNDMESKFTGRIL